MTFIGPMSTDFQLHRGRKAQEALFSPYSLKVCTAAFIAFGKNWMDLLLEIVYSVKNAVVTPSMKLYEHLCIPFICF